MKSLVVYYSLEGNTKFIADSIVSSVGADVIRLKPKKDIPKKGFLKFLFGGFKAKLRSKPALQSYDKDTSGYEVIFIGSPVWAGTNVPALNTFINTERLKNKKIAFFCTYAGGDGTIIEDVKVGLSENKFLGEIGFILPLQKNKQKCEESAKDWAKRMIDKSVAK